MPWRSARRLRGHAAAVDAGDDVHARVVAGRLERLAGDALELHAREVLVEVAAVDAEGALARLEDHARDGALALAGGAGSGRRRRGRAACARRAPARRRPRRLRSAPSSSAYSASAYWPNSLSWRACSSSTRSGSRCTPGMTSSSGSACAALACGPALARAPRPRRPAASAAGSSAAAAPQPQALRRRLLGSSARRPAASSAAGCSSSAGASSARARQRLGALDLGGLGGALGGRVRGRVLGSGSPAAPSGASSSGAVRARVPRRTSGFDLQWLGLLCGVRMVGSRVDLQLAQLRRGRAGCGAACPSPPAG